MESTTYYTLEDVKKFNKPLDKFLVKLEDNTFGVRFIGFKVRDFDNGEIFHEFKSRNIFELDYFADNILEYAFPNKILKAKTIGTDLTFVVGDVEVKNLDFIEKHYIDGELMKAYEFNFPMFPPGSENNIEFIYPLPNLSKNIKEKLKKNEPIEAFSDTFILVDQKLIIHRRAHYFYK